MPELIKDNGSFQEIIKGNQLSVVHFSADWVEQCKQVDDVMDSLSKQPEYANVKFAKCLAEELDEISLKYNIEAAPTIILFRSGKDVDKVNGADPAKLTAKIKQNNTEVDNVNDKSGDNLEQRLKSLINKHKVMLFMKGNPETPRCGFSRQIIEILKSSGVAYDSFDILSDEEVRQGLKTYSDWPTYPQLYVNGELLGGLDIIKEMQAAGELESALKG
ncbi:Thioredoxin [Popillia japonica]|uniref:Thioredoxin n=1 Tax=Popillia japonica TaxID=7064 RepID=A0AAW1LW65_POPJA